MYITADSITWAHMLTAAEADWELVDIEDEDAYRRKIRNADIDTVGYYHPSQSGSDNKIYRRAYKRDADDFIVLDENGKPQPLDLDGYSGREVIERKLEFCRNYLQDNFQLDLEQLRTMVQERLYVKDANGYWKLDRDGNLVNRLLMPSASGATIIDSLTNEIYSLKNAQ